MKERGAEPAPLIVGFPKAICTAINNVICHGIPKDKILKDGDIIGIDVSLEKDGYYGDTCKTFMVGKTPVLAKRLVKVAQECLYKAIDKVKPGVSLKVIGQTIQHHAHSHKFSVVREYCGHGIGTQLHEDVPQVVHFDDDTIADFFLEEGMTFTIEPMINAGKRGTKVLSDKWTVVTRDRSLSAQWEHTLVVTDSGCEVLTAREEESF